MSSPTALDPPFLPNRPPVVAAIDLGTNSCRLLIARLEGQGLKIVDSFSRVVRLGEGVQRTGVLSHQAIIRAIDALRICRSKLHDNQVQLVRAVTTEACRRATNASDLIQRVQDELGIAIEVISSDQEAKLALSGCSGVLSPLKEHAIVFDIGGGSTEIMWLKFPKNIKITMYPQLQGYLNYDMPELEILDWISLPYGVVTLSETYGEYISDNEIFREIGDKVAALLVDFSKKNNITNDETMKSLQMVGTSGTVTTLAAIHLNLDRYDRRVIDGASLELSKVSTISESILNMGQIGRLSHPCIGAGRADLVVAGTAILKGICQTWQIDQLRVADRGVREGILFELARSYLKAETEGTLGVSE